MNWTTVIGFTLLLIFPLLWRNSHKFRYCVKLFYFNSLMALVSVFIVPLALRKPKSVENLKMASWCWTKFFVEDPILGLGFELRGREHMVSNKPFIVVCNHQSSLDMIASLTFLPDRCTFMVKKSVMYAGLFGLGAWLSGIVFVDRSNPQKAKQTLKETVDRIHKENIKIWVWPEGTRRMEDELLPFKKGAFNIAVEAQIPIVPAVVSSYKNFYDKKRKILEPGKVIVQCLPPVSTQGLTLDDVTDLTNKVRSQMNKVYLEISKEVPVGKEFASVTASLK